MIIEHYRSHHIAPILFSWIIHVGVPVHSYECLIADRGCYNVFKKCHTAKNICRNINISYMRGAMSTLNFTAKNLCRHQ